MYTYICILFALNQKRLKMLFEDVEVTICKVMCSFVEQNLVC